MPKSSEWSPPFRFSDQNFVCISQFLFSRSFQIIHPFLRPCLIFSNRLFILLCDESLVPCAIHNLQDHPLIYSPRLFIKYIRSYPPYLKVICSNHIPRRLLALVTRTHNKFWQSWICAWKDISQLMLDINYALWRHWTAAQNLHWKWLLQDEKSDTDVLQFYVLDVTVASFGTPGLGGGRWFRPLSHRS